MTLIVDEVMLREPNLLIPGKKPVGNVKIDWSHPLSKGLKYAFLDLNRNLVDGKKTVATGGEITLVTRSDGSLWNYIGDGQYVTFDTPATMFAAEEATIFYELQNNSTSNNESALHELSTSTASTHRFYASQYYDTAFASTRRIQAVTPTISPLTAPSIYCITSKAGTVGHKLIEGYPLKSLTVNISLNRNTWALGSTSTIGTGKGGLTYDWVGWIKHVYLSLIHI